MAAQAVGLAAACDYLTDLGMARVTVMSTPSPRPCFPVLRNDLGPGHRTVDGKDRSGAVAFVIDGIHPHDVGQILDDAGVAVRVVTTAPGPCTGGWA